MDSYQTTYRYGAPTPEQELFGPASNAMDIQTGAIWDSLHYYSGASLTNVNSQLFTNVGSPSGKSLADTNLKIYGGGLPVPEQFCIRRVRFTFSSRNDPRDMAHFLEEHMWEFWVGMKLRLSGSVLSFLSISRDHAHSPIRRCEFCDSVYANQAHCPGCGASQFSLVGYPAGEAGSQYILNVDPHILILYGSRFYAQFQGPVYTFHRDFKLWCHLEGLHAYGVQ